ncbi:MAG: RNA 3'-terminal phosphate cyclase [Armatimonadota bacterium]|nr:RNA 3'-terminal phosphate cyclase [Armatimonadota bacterium]
MNAKEIYVDGSWGEGGGQVLRTALALSVITGRPLRMVNIRARRSRPGLQPQHLAAVRATASICRGRLEGDAEGSRQITLQPGPPRPGEYAFDVGAGRGSAGSAVLVFQTLLLPLALAGGTSRVVLRGGTHNPWAPPFPYLERVFLRVVAACGLHARVQLEQAGWYPVGQGEFRAEVGPCAGLRPLQLVEGGPVTRLACYSASSGLPAHVKRRQAARAQSRLQPLHRPVEVEEEELPSPGVGSVLFVHVERKQGCGGFTGLGARGKPAERVADEACTAAVSFLQSDAAVDSYLADQLALPLALASGVSRYRTPIVTEHLRTNLWVIAQFLPIRWEVDDTAGLVTIEGAGGC